MENVVLTVHLILAICLIGIVLLQRSEGGMGSMGGGGSGGGLVSSRGAATALGKLTWGFAIAFIATSIALTIISAENSSKSSVLDGLSATPSAETDTQPTEVPAAEDLLPPSTTEPQQTTPRAE